MTRTIFVNLPVEDVARATAFYQALGFTRDPRFSNDTASAMQWSDAIAFMLLGRDYFQTFTDRPIADSRATAAHLLCLSLDGREAVDAFVQAGLAAGGTETRAVQDHGFMYGRSIADPDGHILEPMWMDVVQFEAMRVEQAA